MTKKTVRYTPTAVDFIKEGQSAYIYPVDHPDTSNVTNGKQVRTSIVIEYNEITGVFETLNTIYVPFKEIKND